MSKCLLSFATQSSTVTINKVNIIKANVEETFDSESATFQTLFEAGLHETIFMAIKDDYSCRAPTGMITKMTFPDTFYVKTEVIINENFVKESKIVLENNLFNAETVEGENMKLTKIVVEELQELTCDQCQKLFSNKLLLITHQKLIHNGKMAYTCQYCLKVFPNGNALKKHKVGHEDLNNNFRMVIDEMTDQSLGQVSVLMNLL